MSDTPADQAKHAQDAAAMAFDTLLGCLADLEAHFGRTPDGVIVRGPLPGERPSRIVRVEVETPERTDEANRSAQPDDPANARRLLAMPRRGDTLTDMAHGNLAAAQAHALLYIGDQVKALVEAIAPPPPPPPRVSDIDPALFGYVPHRVDVDPTALHMPTIQFTRELLERFRERLDGYHRPVDGERGGCTCDPICRAITEAIR